MRPRMLIILAVFDMLAAICQLIANFPEVGFPYSLSHQVPYGILGLCFGPFFQFSSWTWTCCIAFHGTILQYCNIAILQYFHMILKAPFQQHSRFSLHVCLPIEKATS
jgi:hypothetical protein